jgi:hypothetical protein
MVANDMTDDWLNDVAGKDGQNQVIGHRMIFEIGIFIYLLFKKKKTLLENKTSSGLCSSLIKKL